MIQWVLAGFSFGLVGSVHCIGMCGPLALSLPGSQTDRVRFMVERLFYNVGRTVTYATLGGLVGAVGSGVSLAGAQHTLSVSVGFAMVGVALIPWVRKQAQRLEEVPSSFVRRVLSPVGTLYQRGGPVAMIAVGLLNGLLPCGFVYAALATAVTAGRIAASVAFMAAFGAGTMPAMFGVSMLGRLADSRWRVRIQRYAPYGLALVGGLLILRGLALGGMVSPVLPTELARPLSSALGRLWVGFVL